MQVDATGDLSPDVLSESGRRAFVALLRTLNLELTALGCPLRRGLDVAIVRRHPPVTSIRKLELYGSGEVLLLILRWLLFPRRTGRDKASLHVFYDGRR